MNFNDKRPSNTNFQIQFQHMSQSKFRIHLMTDVEQVSVCKWGESLSQIDF